MDVYEATRIVFSRIQGLDPENATKIMGLLLLQDHGDKEMIRLAFGPESLLHALVLKAHKDLGLGSAPVSPAPVPSPFVLGRQNSANSRLMQPQPVFSRSNRSFNEFHHGSDELSSPSSFKSMPFGTAGDFVDEFKLQDQLSVDSVGGNGDAFFADSSSDEMYPYGLSRRSCSAAETCLYFARGFCKNGSACRFVHGLPEDMSSAKMDAAVEQQCHELLMRSRSPRSGVSSQFMASSFPYSPTGSLPSLSPSTPSKCLSFLLQQQHQHECQRIAAAAAAIARTRLDPAARQIYLTFPADSTFREEDVSNYFSIYGPVQDVRIPYQQKRMFGFVTFVYPETVKLILAKGNPHFVCDSRVLVKPYKEKGKILERKHSQGERGELNSCITPTGLSLDSRGDAFDFQQLGAKMIYNTNNHELLLRRKLEEQQAAELQKAIELQQRRFMGLHLLDLKKRNMATAPVPINNTDPIISAIDSSSSGSSNGSLESSSPEYESGAAAMDKKVHSCHGILQETTVVAADKQESNGEADPKDDGDYQESFGHNLPDSPFASPKKSSSISNHFAATEADVAAYNGHGQPSYNSFGHNLSSPKILPASSTLDVAPLKSCYFQMPRFSDHGAIGM